ncbi:hypothetical protein D3C87_1877490 [compost metagenome]
MVVEDDHGSVQEGEDGRVLHRVEDEAALFPAHHQAPRAQHRQLLGEGGRLDPQQLGQIVDAPLALAQRVDDLDAQRVGQRLEEFGFEAA